ncbi:MAG: sodium/proline symporter, partial [Verrucomicrobia bacterium]|nr:sodium/proline symporter [Verrucomicrobiota bacterium]
LGAAVSVGLIAIAFFKNGIDNPELVFVEMVKTLFHPMAAGIVMCGMLAATISTMDSQLLVGASTITEDLYKQLIAPKISSNREVFVFRMSVLVLSAIAFWIALGKNKTIMEVVYFAWAGLGCTFGPLLLASLYSKKPNYYGALSGILTGGITAAVWPTVNGWLVNQGFSCSIMSMLVAFPLSLVTIFTVSYLTKAKAIRENS